MNIKDFKAEQIEGDKLVAIFDKQKALMEKYHHIESASGLCQTEDCPVNLHDRKGQARLKDFSWRVTEEIAEAMEALPQMKELTDTFWTVISNSTEYTAEQIKEAADKYNQETDDINLHFLEELVDALHFLTEKTILEGITPQDIHSNLCGELKEGEDILDNLFKLATYQGIPSLNDAYADFITALGLTNNCLKNKPWKQSMMKTDVKKYNSLAIAAWYRFIRLLASAGLDSQLTADLYLRKNQVNAFRQRSNY